MLPLLKNRETVLAANDLKTQDVEVKAWGCTLRVRCMTMAERNEMMRRATDAKTSVACWLVALLTVDENGKPVFTEADVEALEKKNFRAVDIVANAITEVNGISEKKVEAAEKN